MDDRARERVLNLCPSCGRQYVVSHLDSGARVRCHCGARFGVVQHASRSPRALKCSNCGGVLADAARKCGYCSAEITLEERRLDSVCPKCFARMASDAHFCMDCGIEIAPQIAFAIADGQVCPRCRGDVQSRDLGHVALVECRMCAGMWLPQDVFLKLCERAEAEAVPPGQLSNAPLPGKSANFAQGYIPCLSCKQLMMRKNFASASGVIMDVCRDHGVWLDAQELERILAFIRTGGLDRARQREIERLREEQRKLDAQRKAAAFERIDPGDWGGGRDIRWGRRGDAFGATIELLLDALF